MSLDYCVNYTSMKIVMLMLLIIGISFGYILGWLNRKRHSQKDTGEKQ